MSTANAGRRAEVALAEPCPQCGQPMQRLSKTLLECGSCEIYVDAAKGVVSFQQVRKKGTSCF